MNFFGRITSNTGSPHPEKRGKHSPALLSFLEENPHLCSMKNFKVVELMRENNQLKSVIQTKSFAEKYSNKVRKAEVKDMLTEIVNMSRHTEVEKPIVIERIMKKYGYDVSEDGFLIGGDEE